MRALSTIRFLFAAILTFVCFVFSPISAEGGNLIETVVGGGNGDGYPADFAKIVPKGIAFDPFGNLLIADTSHNRVRRVDARTNVIDSIAGTGDFGYSGDGGLAIVADMTYAIGVAADANGNVYFSDHFNHRVRRIGASTGIITTAVGTGAGEFSGDGGLAINAGIAFPAGLAVAPDQSLLIADVPHHRIRRVDRNGIITTFAGTNFFGYDGDGQRASQTSLNSPADVAVDSAGNVYIADTGNCRIRRVDVQTKLVETIAGSGECGYSGDGGPATEAKLNGPQYVAVDSADSVYVSEAFAPRVRRVDLHTGIITRFAGTGLRGTSGDGGPATAALLESPTGLLVDAQGRVYIGDVLGGVVRRVDRAGVIDTVVGGANGDGVPADVAEIAPKGLAMDVHGNLFIADTSNNRVRRVDALSNIIETIAGTGDFGFAGDGGPAVQADLAYPTGVAVGEDGDVFFSDYFNHRVRQVDASSKRIATFAGTGVGDFFGDGGSAITAGIAFPSGVAIGPGHSLLIADVPHHRIRRVDALGVIATIAGTDYFGYNGDGQPATAASLNNPTDVATDGEGNIYIVDNGNCRIRRIDAHTKLIETVAGSGECGYSGDGGQATEAKLNGPRHLALDGNGFLYVSESFAPRVRRVDLSSGIITRFAGTGIHGSSGDGGEATLAQLDSPTGLLVDPSGSYLYIADVGAGNIRRVHLDPEPLPTPTPRPGGNGPCVLDVDGIGPGPYTVTDMVYVMRYLVKLAPVPQSFRLLDPSIPSDATITANIETALEVLDVDSNGQVGVSTDVLYVARHRSGLIPVPQTFRALDRTIPTDSQIIAAIDAICP